jgi:hypothetical protein
MNDHNQTEENKNKGQVINENIWGSEKSNESADIDIIDDNGEDILKDSETVQEEERTS